jgi:hypothetical protein
MNDLATTHPELAAELTSEDPTTLTAGSNKRVAWRCPKGHDYTTAPHLRTSQGQGCPYCSGRRVLADFNDLATTHADLAAEADGWDPRTISMGSHQTVKWKCKAGHTFSATPNSRTSKASGCPTCANLVIARGFNDIATTHPDLAKQAHGWDPTTIGGGSGARLLWECDAGHVWETTPINRTWNKTGCPICSNFQVLAGYNDLATLFPAVAGQAHGWDPSTVAGRSKSKRRWRCDLGHEWNAVVSARTLAGTGCPFCAGSRALPGFNDLATKFPHIAAQAVGWDPSHVMPSSNTQRRWRCDLGHEWMAAPGNRTQQGQNCPYCSNKRVLPGFNDLATTHPHMVSEALFDTASVVAGSQKRLPWLCQQCGHKWTATPQSRVRGTGCPSCAPGGYDPGEPAWLYLFEQPLWEMQQVGITNDPGRRIAEHGKNGWALLDMRGPMDGVLAKDWERSILLCLRARAVPTTASGVLREPSRETARRGRRHGEAWWMRDLEVRTVRELMHLVEQREEADPPSAGHHTSQRVTKPR